MKRRVWASEDVEGQVVVGVERRERVAKGKWKCAGERWSICVQ